MADSRKHRGPHPSDPSLFGESALADLRDAVRDLSWLLSRGYAGPSALQLVGNRYNLRERQRRAVRHAACSDAAVSARASRRLDLGDLAGRDVVIDGFNCIIAVEAALSGGVILHCRDGVYRDLASVHGSYRQVHETRRAIELCCRALATARVSRCHWLLDRPVSNSGRLGALIREVAAEVACATEVELLFDPDGALIEHSRAGAEERTAVAASGDSMVIELGGSWIDVPQAVIAAHIPDAWLVVLKR